MGKRLNSLTGAEERTEMMDGGCPSAERATLL